MTSTRRRRLWLAATGLALLAAPGCKTSASAPTTFGVNITVDAQALSADQRSKASIGSLEVTGAENEVQRFPIATAIGSGELKFRYIPKVTTGDLTFVFQALDANDVLYGSGTSQPVAIAPTAVSAAITLAPATGALAGDGAACTQDGQCASGACADHVCCHESCDGVCRSCAQANAKGLCTFFAAGTDPQNECQGFTGTVGNGGAGGGGAGGAGGAGGGTADAGAPGDAGGADGGETIMPPDGGVKAMPTACGGTCNGAGACKYADKGTACGTPFCNNRRDLVNITCDGNGTCGFGLQTCAGGFACQLESSPGMCRTKCTLDLECQSGYFCDNGACVAQKTLGKTCTGDGECGSGHCATGVCCKTPCAAPNSCDSSGVCRCQGLTCNSGVSCTLFYPDVDVDGFGDKNGTPQVGCADTPPTNGGHWVADDTDCDDHDANVFPGQTGYFSTISKGVGTFDYNCDGTIEKGVPEYPGAACTFCPSACGTNGCSDPTSALCASANTQASLSCPREGGICPILLNPTTPVLSGAEVALPLSSGAASPSVVVIQLACCGCNDHAGFTAAVNCGQTGTYVTCGTCGAASGTVGSGTPTSSGAKTQTCH
jgi:hypothetical protein